MAQPMQLSRADRAGSGPDYADLGVECPPSRDKRNLVVALKASEEKKLVKSFFEPAKEFLSPAV